jgi:uncharacterized DUF497 family protein
MRGCQRHRMLLTATIQRIYVLGVDVHFSRNGLNFVWNTDKAAANVSKHKIRFESATFAFLDPFVLFEDASVSNELREAAIGLSESLKLMFVVHIEHEGEVIRIISAREATSREQRKYENNA